MPKISVIIPFYNVEQYIFQCLKSVQSQTLEDIEIICVNDASTDNSRQIIENCALNDKRIKLIDIPKRHGQGYARNRAIETAQGEYIGFVDSDDFIEPDMFKKLYETAKENDDDIVICQAREYDDLNEKLINSDYYSLSILERIENNVFSAKETKNEILDINVVLWNKIYKKSYMDKINAKFPEGFIYEDLPFFFETYLPAERIQIIWDYFYIYRVNRKNSTMQQFNNKILDRLDMVSLTYEIFKRFDFLSDEMNRIKGWIINDLFHRYTLLKENYHKEFFFRMKKIFQSLDIQDLENPFWKKVYHFQGYLMVLNNDYESFNRKIFTEYLDIHKVEDRLKSELCNSIEVDKKLSRVYSDIGKIYDYTNQLSNDLKNELLLIIEQNKNEAKEEIQHKCEEEKQIYQNLISELESKITSELNIQKDNYEKQLRILQDKIGCLEKSPIEKLKDKLKKNN